MRAIPGRQRTRGHLSPSPTKFHQDARRVSDPASRAYALALEAHHADDKQFYIIAKEAVRAALEVDDPYRSATALFLPLEAMLERGQKSLVGTTVEKALSVAARLANPVRRAEALFGLWATVYPLKAIADTVLPHLLAACREMNSWKAPRLLHFLAVDLVALGQTAQAQAVLDQMGDGPQKRQALRRIAAREFWFPYPFVWPDD